MNSPMRNARLAIGLCGFFGLISGGPTIAQIVPDSTLPSPSTVRIEGNAFVIEGGGSTGPNLFHSFSEFSVPIGNEAFFNNAASIENIIGRVTGNGISNIDGVLRANGAANLFFINPNGIAFGPEARLDIGGSFVASSAESLVFADGNTFSAVGSGGSPPLLTIATPVGLQLGSNPGDIRVAGIGSNLTQSLIDFNFSDNTNPGLQVAPDRTLAFVGGAIVLEGGILTAPSGRIELGGVADTTVGITTVPEGFSLSYDENADFQPILFSQRALADTDGTLAGASGEGGSIRVRGESLRLIENSLLFVENQGMQAGGAIDVSVTGPIEVTDVEPLPGGEGRSLSGIVAIATGEGGSGDIDLEAGSLFIDNGAIIINNTFGNGNGGNINVAVEDRVRVALTDPAVAEFGSVVGQTTLETATSGPATAGNVRITARRVLVEGGGILVSNTGFGVAGRSGNVTIDASESVEVRGFFPGTTVPSILGTTSNTSTDTGSIKVNTQRVVVRDGAVLATTAFAGGASGNVRIDASESVEISNSPSPSRRSGIGSSVLNFSFLGFPIPTSDAGTTIVRTENLIVDDANLTAINQGEGNGGTIAVEAEKIRITNGGQITTEAIVGNAGNITIAVDDRLRLRDFGRISASAAGSGNSGSITISAEDVSVRTDGSIHADAADGNAGSITIAAEKLRVSPGQITASAIGFGNGGTIAIAAEDSAVRQGSSIAVNATDGNAGNIAIAAEDLAVRQGSTVTANAVSGDGGLVQIAVEDLSVSPNSSITATSEFGTDGIVAIVESDDGFAEAFQQFSEAFAGLPAELADIVSTLEGDRCSHSSTTSDATEHFVEARGWQHDRDGNVLLTAEAIDESCAIASR